MAKATATPEWKRLISRCQKLWEAYDKAPTKAKLEAFGAHIKKMKASKSVRVKTEAARATRSFNAEWKRQGYKSPVAKKKTTKRKSKKKTTRRRVKNFAESGGGDSQWYVREGRAAEGSDLDYGSRNIDFMDASQAQILGYLKQWVAPAPLAKWEEDEAPEPGRFGRSLKVLATTGHIVDILLSSGTGTRDGVGVYLSLDREVVYNREGSKRTGIKPWWLVLMGPQHPGHGGGRGRADIDEPGGGGDIWFRRTFQGGAEDEDADVGDSRARALGSLTELYDRVIEDPHGLTDAEIERVRIISTLAKRLHAERNPKPRKNAKRKTTKRKSKKKTTRRKKNPYRGGAFDFNELYARVPIKPRPKARKSPWWERLVDRVGGRVETPLMFHIRPTLVLDDGTKLSIQASPDHFSDPRSEQGPWSIFEVSWLGVPEFDAYVKKNYLDLDLEPTSGYPDVYSIPVELIEEVFEQRGYQNLMMQYPAENPRRNARAKATKRQKNPNMFTGAKDPKQGEEFAEGWYIHEVDEPRYVFLSSEDLARGAGADWGGNLQIYAPSLPGAHPKDYRWDYSGDRKGRPSADGVVQAEDLRSAIPKVIAALPTANPKPRKNAKKGFFPALPPRAVEQKPDEKDPLAWMRGHRAADPEPERRGFFKYSQVKRKIHPSRREPEAISGEFEANPCPTCKAPSGNPCTTASGKRAASPHRARASGNPKPRKNAQGKTPDDRKFTVRNLKTGRVHGPYKGRSRATRVQDKIDNEYGAYITSVDLVKSNPKPRKNAKRKKNPATDAEVRSKAAKLNKKAAKLEEMLASGETSQRDADFWFPVDRIRGQFADASQGNFRDIPSEHYPGWTAENFTQLLHLITFGEPHEDELQTSLFNPKPRTRRRRKNASRLEELASSARYRELTKAQRMAMWSVSQTAETTDPSQFIPYGLNSRTMKALVDHGLMEEKGDSLGFHRPTERGLLVAIWAAKFEGEKMPWDVGALGGMPNPKPRKSARRKTTKRKAKANPSVFVDTRKWAERASIPELKIELAELKLKQADPDLPFLQMTQGLGLIDIVEREIRGREAGTRKQKGLPPHPSRREPKAISGSFVANPVEKGKGKTLFKAYCKKRQAFKKALVDDATSGVVEKKAEVAGAALDNLIAFIQDTGEPVGQSIVGINELCRSRARIAKLSKDAGMTPKDVKAMLNEVGETMSAGEGEVEAVAELLINPHRR